jgi:signal recognition particle subunit SEC65
MRNIKILLPLLLIVPIFLTDCTRVETIKYDEVERAPKPEDYEIEIYTESGAPRGYKIIGTIYVEGNKSNSEIIKQIKSEARKIGADAIVDMKNHGTKDMKQHWGATAIVWTDKELE